MWPFHGVATATRCGHVIDTTWQLLYLAGGGGGSHERVIHKICYIMFDCSKADGERKCESRR